jgi:hypothetical protein
MNAPSSTITPEQQRALDIARDLVRVGVPLFVAPPDPSKPTGFALPGRWQTAEPALSTVDAWQPGWALGMVTGVKLDLVDIDPRNGGDASLLGLDGVALALAATPSGGEHYFVAPIGVESRDGVYPGVDLKSGNGDRSGRGFAFIAPTVKPSKVDGQPRAYEWIVRPVAGSICDTANYVSTHGVHGPLAVLRDRVTELRAAAGRPDLAAGPRTVARSVAAREWNQALTRLVDDIRHWNTHGWGGEAHAGLLAASTHLARLAPEHAEQAFLQAFAAAGAEPDEDDLRKLATALERAVPDRVVDDAVLPVQDRFWLGGEFAGSELGPKGEGAPPAPDPPPAGTFDFVTPERVRNRQPPPQATYGTFGGTVPVFYGEGVHWLQGESESGKSWVALAHALEVMRAGRPALFVDYEDTEHTVLERLAQLGATDEEFGRLVYVAAVDIAYQHIRDHVVTAVDRCYGIAVIDGVTTALQTAGLSGRDEQELTQWTNDLPRRVASAQVVDHVVKALDDRRGMAIGTQAKKSVVTGTAFEVVCTEKFGRGSAGTIELYLQKDKRGGVRAHLPKGLRLRFASDPDDGHVELITAAVARQHNPDAFFGNDPIDIRAQALLERLRAHEAAGWRPPANLSVRELVRVLRDELNERGANEEFRRAAHLFKAEKGQPVNLGSDHDREY